MGIQHWQLVVRYLQAYFELATWINFAGTRLFSIWQFSTLSSFLMFPVGSALYFVNQKKIKLRSLFYCFRNYCLFCSGLCLYADNTFSVKGQGADWPGKGSLFYVECLWSLTRLVLWSKLTDINGRRTAIGLGGRAGSCPHRVHRRKSRCWKIKHIGSQLQ